MSFVLFAATLVLIAIALIVLPVVRAQRRIGLAGGLTAVVVVALGVGLYAWLGTPFAWNATDADPAMKLTHMAETARAHPKDWQRWVELGHAYREIGRYGTAADAYKNALDAQHDPSPQLIAAYAEAQVLANPDALNGQAGKLFDMVLKADPQNPKGLWWGGLAAYNAGKFDTAISRWQKLEARNPPDGVRQVLDRYLARARQNAAAGKRPSAASKPWLTAEVELAPALQPMPADTTLFVFLRRPGGGGPPLAVKRIADPALPASISLSAADSPLGQQPAPGAKLTLVARLSSSGRPLPASGDLQGSLNVTLDKESAATPVKLVIDRKVK